MAKHIGDSTHVCSMIFYKVGTIAHSGLKQLYTFEGLYLNNFFRSVHISEHYANGYKIGERSIIVHFCAEVWF